MSKDNNLKLVDREVFRTGRSSRTGRTGRSRRSLAK